MNCITCGTSPGANVIALTKEWYCPKCKDGMIELREELRRLYLTGFPGRYLYVSELSNNLDKVAQYFRESVPMELNPFCSITLLFPASVDQAHGQFDGIYVDRDAVSAGQFYRIQDTKLANFGYIKWVNPTTMQVES